MGQAELLYENTPFTPPSELIIGFDLRRKLDITQIPSYRLTRPLDVLVYEADGKFPESKIAIVHRLPTHNSTGDRFIGGYGETLERACQSFISELVLHFKNLRNIGSLPERDRPQAELEKQYLDLLLIPEQNR